MLDDLTSSLHDGMSLDSTAIEGAIDAMVREEHSAEQKAAFLTALANKGETVEEISGFACGLRAMAVAPPIDRSLRDEAILDVCGTGGDHQNTFNISTTVALVLAASGVTVAKHGNRAITSKSGSADVLEALGIPVDLPPDQAAASLQDHGFAFLFAPHYHPAFKHIVPARKLCTGPAHDIQFPGSSAQPRATQCTAHRRATPRSLLSTGSSASKHGGRAWHGGLWIGGGGWIS